MSSVINLQAFPYKQQRANFSLRGGNIKVTQVSIFPLTRLVYGGVCINTRLQELNHNTFFGGSSCHLLNHVHTMFQKHHLKKI